MKVSEAVKYCFEYHGANSKKNSIRSHEFVLSRFDRQFGDRELASLTPDEILRFLNQITEGKKQTTKRTRYFCLKAFFNLIRHTLDPEVQNPCNAPMVVHNKRWTRWPDFFKQRGGCRCPKLNSFHVEQILGI